MTITIVLFPPQRQLKEIDNRIRHLLEQQKVILPGLFENLPGHGVTIVSPDQLDDADKAHVKTFIFNEVMQIITPQTLDPAHPFPFIANEGLGMFLDLKEANNRNKTALIMLSPVIRRFCCLPGEDDRFITLEDAILLNLDEIFPHHELMDHVLFRVLRDSEIEYDEEAEDLVTTFENALRARRRGNVIALQLSADQSSPLIDVLLMNLKYWKNNRFYVGGMIDLSDLSQICNSGNDQLRFPSYSARFPERIRDFGGDCFAAIRAKDILVHHPYESFDVVLQFLSGSGRPESCFYPPDSLSHSARFSIVRALISAAEQGKSVTALVEIKARFDEEVNIRLARDLERAGVQVVYGFVDLKTHAKLSLVVRQEENGLRSYAHCGTGNYHPSKAKIYTDLSFFTCDPDICYDIVRIFNYMTSYVKPLKLNKMIFAPVTARDHFVASVEAEIEAAKAGRPSGIWIKVNSLVDREFIELLYKASQAGVPIELIVRGICCLRPGVEGLSEHIKVRSLIGRFLEHARIYVFANEVIRLHPGQRCISHQLI